MGQKQGFCCLKQLFFVLVHDGRCSPSCFIVRLFYGTSVVQISVLPTKGVLLSNRRSVCKPVYDALLFGWLRGIFVHSVPQANGIQGNHFEERLLDQAQAWALYTPPPPLFGGSFA